MIRREDATAGAGAASAGSGKAGGRSISAWARAGLPGWAEYPLAGNVVLAGALRTARGVSALGTSEGKTDGLVPLVSTPEMTGANGLAGVGGAAGAGLSGIVGDRMLRPPEVKSGDDSTA